MSPHRRLVFAACLAAALLAVCERAEADPVPKHEHWLVWRYPRFRTWEYVSSTVVLGTGFYLNYGTGPFPDMRHNGPILIDEQVREAVRANSEDTRADLSRVSDLFWHPVQYYSTLIDSLYLPLVLDDLNTDVAWQMTMLNWQALGFAFFVTRLAHVTVGRARPMEYGCGTAQKPCHDSGPSFFSGHTAMAAAGAGLTCAHHAALHLYGGGWPDTAICALLSAAAGVNGYLRIRGDDHWFSDVVTGYVVGWTIGFGLPWLLHYGHGTPRPLGAGLLPEGVAIVPLAFEGGAGVGLMSAM